MPRASISAIYFFLFEELVRATKQDLAENHEHIGQKMEFQLLRQSIH